MFFEDGRDQTFAAVLLLVSQKTELNCPNLEVATVAEFLDYAKSVRLSKRDKETIVEQAVLLLDQFYAHLPFKRARYATDPVQRLRLIHAQLGSISELTFHEEMIRAFMRLRDAHTFYGLPDPYRGAFAFLPFRMDCFYEKSGKRRYIVTAILEGFHHPGFSVNAEITLWHGIPVDRAIEREADLEPGGNPASRFVRGLKRMTKRTLTFSVPPDENYVVIQYIPATGGGSGGEPHSIILPWYVAKACFPLTERTEVASSVNQAMAELTRFGNLLWKRKQVVRERLSQTAADSRAAEQPLGAPQHVYPPLDLRHESRYPQVFDFQYTGGLERAESPSPTSLCDPANADQKFGYIRIKTFDLDPADVNASDKFVEEFSRIVCLMQEVAPDGLILDVRSNPGGVIDAAERILQLLTPSEIEPAKFHFINSRLTQQIAGALHDSSARKAVNSNQREWLPWVDDLVGSIASGHTVTPGWPLTNPDDCNDTGQQYQGPVTLIIDALAYSATDIFAAGFQDHDIGPVIGVDESTGGGGANRWLHEELRLKLLSTPEIPLKKLPAGAQMGLAIRRSSRVGLHHGANIEDLGVRSDTRHRTTRNDLLHHDCDLLQFACHKLGTLETPRLKILKAEAGAGEIVLTLETKNLFRLECLVNGKPQCTFAASAPQPFHVPVGGLMGTPAQIRVNGFALVHNGSRLKIVATDKLDLTAPLDLGTAATAAS